MQAIRIDTRLGNFPLDYYALGYKYYLKLWQGKIVVCIKYNNANSQYFTIAEFFGRQEPACKYEWSACICRAFDRIFELEW